MKCEAFLKLIKWMAITARWQY